MLKRISLDTIHTEAFSTGKQKLCAKISKSVISEISGVSGGKMDTTRRMGSFMQTECSLEESY